ncbi:hypothetical protein phiOC_p212 [Ochrobactrum phage vB_OspM_OC]|nr:hypothetical protein phiOC_p212 [Ochrobactrum phage vB_OspM_OC]
MKNMIKQETVKYPKFTRDDAYERAREMMARGYYQGDLSVDELAEKIYKANKERVNEYMEKQTEEMRKMFEQESDKGDE